MFNTKTWFINHFRNVLHKGDSKKLLLFMISFHKGHEIIAIIFFHCMKKFRSVLINNFLLTLFHFGLSFLFKKCFFGRIFFRYDFGSRALSLKNLNGTFIPRFFALNFFYLLGLLSSKINFRIGVRIFILDLIFLMIILIIFKISHSWLHL